MKLKTLIETMDERQRARFAELVGTTENMLRYQYANGHKRPSIRMATRIVVASRKLNPKEPSKWCSLSEWFPELRARVVEARA